MKANQSKTVLVKIILISFVIIVFMSLVGFNPFEFGNIKNKIEKKLIVIGIDSLDYRMMEKLIENGKLPNFKKLSEEGDFKQLQSTIPPETPVAWSAAATGSNPGKYGIYDFINRDPKTYLPKLNLAVQEGFGYKNSMKGTPFWRIISNNNIPIIVIRWPVTFPPEKIGGKMLSGLGVVDIKGLLNSYRFYTSDSKYTVGEGSEKVILVETKNKTIGTTLHGPFVMKGSERVEVGVPMRIEIVDGGALLDVDGSKYRVGEGNWSEFVRVKFPIGLLEKVYGIFKAYLISTDPFNMYITSVQIDPENPLFDISYPKEYSKELVKEIGLFYTLGMPEDTKAISENKISKEIFLEQIKQIENERERMFWYEFERFREGAFVFSFDSGDRLKHIFWKSKVLEKEEFNISKEIEDYYIEKDKLLGKVLEKIDGNTSLIIFSDHGFNSFERAVDINKWLVDNGYMVLTKEIDENDAGELFKYVDWSKTKAYALGFTSIYINVKGREGKGIVEEKDKGKLINEIIEKLGKLEDLKYDVKVITSLYKKEDIYSGPYVEEAPDVVIGFNQGYRMSWQTAVGGIAPEVLIDNKKEWSGDHLVDRSHVPGVLFANFKIKKENPELIDIAPTVLDLLNIEIPKEIDGRSLLIQQKKT